jgi:pantoate--beta-alanine ligase
VDLIDTKQGMRKWRQRVLGNVALVPTMGDFHEGHFSLVRAAREAADTVVVSLFVNPTQFGPHEDYTRYPRDLDRDAALARAEGVDCLFAPAAAEMYPTDHETYVYWPRLGSLLCGMTRPTHFRGVATVVLKLFNIVRPHQATFGRKDGQQVILIQRMVEDLDLPVEVMICPTVRDPDGLAVSSRNRYLSMSDRSQAVGLYFALSAAKHAIERGERRSDRLKEIMEQTVAAYSALSVEYVEIVARGTLEATDSIDEDTMIAVAVGVGSTRLIDNLWVVQGKKGLQVEL